MSLRAAFPTLTEHAFYPTLSEDFKGENKVQLSRSPQGNLPYCKVTVGAQTVEMLFDTGATHTTLDVDFVKEVFPEVELYPLALPKSNVQSPVYLFKMRAMHVGNATLTDFYMMATQLDPLAEQMGVPIKGILGLNVMGYAPFLLSLGENVVTWSPTAFLTRDSAALKEYTLLPKAEGAPNRLILSIQTPKGLSVPLLLDTGASFTFLPDQAWEASDQPLYLSATDINQTRERQFMYGVKGEMKMGALSLEVQPVVLAPDAQRPSLLGVDILSQLELYINVHEARLFAKRAVKE
jgi:predicted aspartyl protease